MTATPTTAPAGTRADLPAPSIGDLLTRGAVAGLVAGTAFILANMWFALAVGKPPVAPFLSVSTVFSASATPTMSPVAVVTGVVLHVGLSLVFGIGFALLVAFVPALRAPGALVGAAFGYGLALFVVNFEILGRTVFPFFTNPMGPNQIFELIIHPVVFGLLLVPFFLGTRTRP